jgi:hypothetical protein
MWPFSLSLGRSLSMLVNVPLFVRCSFPMLACLIDDRGHEELGQIELQDCEPVKEWKGQQLLT